MADYERLMLAYVKLAELSRQKAQLFGRDKFLVLAGAAACRAGWLEVAERCRALVLAHSPSHLLGHFERFADAMRSPDFQPFLKQLERFCGSERAESLLAELGHEAGRSSGDAETSAGDWALDLLAGPVPD